MLGFLIGFWSTPTMSVGHLAFAIVVTAYVFIGVRFEENDIAANLGEDYKKYREETPMLIPSLKSKQTT